MIEANQETVDTVLSPHEIAILKVLEAALNCGIDELETDDIVRIWNLGMKIKTLGFHTERALTISVGACAFSKLYA